ncbi:NAD-dependent epimerase/dehydratase [Amycolatopsis rhizosphaerae]|uniref:NAD-dependent epimerase/dehydratase n=1 Tax=Amycolatopsis rhizosphaerae TaxID=2053003 RepID=A0A558D0Z3_9PSEU|nr:NAD-dependent epimerase/dehydratase [Amycolatopsis rhizosphaerae]TVT54691.1 NAD-dependent epimerase/dehydratase [Amycolatopsis rhizosphaerae]
MRSASADERRTVVLGASGLLGTAITRELAARPGRLRLVGRREPVVPAAPRAEVEVHRADLTEPGELARAVAGADAVVHLVAHTTGAGQWRSAENDRAAERVNLGLMRDLIEVLRAQEAATPPAVVFAGSTSQVGRPSAPVLDGSEPDRPITEYDRHKLAAERALEAATAAGVVRGCTLRLGTLFTQGAVPGSLDRGVVATMMRRALAGLPLTMWHDGSVRRDPICVDDVASAFVAALDHADTLAGRHWLIGTGRAVTVRDLFTAIAAAVAELTGKPPVPVECVAPPAESIAGDLVDFVADPSAFRTATGWSARIPLPDALARMASSFAAEGSPSTGGR